MFPELFVYVLLSTDNKFSNNYDAFNQSLEVFGDFINFFNGYIDKLDPIFETSTFNEVEYTFPKGFNLNTHTKVF